MTVTTGPGWPSFTNECSQSALESPLYRHTGSFLHLLHYFYVFYLFYFKHLNHRYISIVYSFGQTNPRQRFCKDFYNLKVYKLCRSDDARTAAERAVRDFIQSSGGDSWVGLTWTLTLHLLWMSASSHMCTS